MKRIIWASAIGTALLGPLGVAILTATAAVGDPTFIRRAGLENTRLTGAQKTCLATWAQGVWPGITPADFAMLSCSALPADTLGEQEEVEATCKPYEIKTYSAAEFVVAEAAGEVEGEETVTGPDSVDAYRPSAEAVLTALQKAGLATCIGGAWPGADGDMFTHLEIWRNNGVYGWLHYHATASATDYLALRAAGLVVKRTGTVAE